MSRKLVSIVGSVLLTGTLMGVGAQSINAQNSRYDDWRYERDRQESREGDRVARAVIGGILGTIRGLDQEGRVRYHTYSGRREVGYLDDNGYFHSRGYYDRYGNLWRYRNRD